MADAKKAPVLGGSGTESLPAALFSEPFHESLIHQTARADLAARRRGTHSSLTRGEVSMTTAKAWRQKGTGRARVGALSVPHRYGGGAAFGPKPRSYVFKVNRRERRRALRSALSVHAERGSVAILDASGFSEPSTKKAAQDLGKWDAETPLLVIVGPDEAAVAKSFRNIDRVTVAQASAAGVADVIGAASIAITKSALDVLAERSGEVSRSGSGESKTSGAAAEPKSEPVKAESEAV